MNTPHHTWANSPIHDELAAWELLKEARRERDEAINNYESAQLLSIRVGEQRDEARAENIGWQNKWQVAVEMAALAQNELTAVTEQRDAVTLRLGNTQERMIDAERQRDSLIKFIEQLEYWRDISECDCRDACDAI